MSVYDGFKLAIGMFLFNLVLAAGTILLAAIF